MGQPSRRWGSGADLLRWLLPSSSLHLPLSSVQQDDGDRCLIGVMKVQGHQGLQVVRL